MSDLPASSLTFLFTEVESSIKLREQNPESVRAALLRHEALLQQAIETHHGAIFKTAGDKFCASFFSTADAVAAALTAQRALLAEAWGAFSLRVRMAVHVGPAIEWEGLYLGHTISHLNHLLSAGHGGQILLSQAAKDLLDPTAFELRDLGKYRLRDLLPAEAIYQLTASTLPVEFSPLCTLETFSQNLPVQTTSFVGREREISEIELLLTGSGEDTAPSHQVAIIGEGGTGKTRLALQVGADLLGAFHDGVWLVHLASITDPNLVLQTVAYRLGISEETGRPLLQTLTDHLHTRRILLILDGCEHLLDACTDLTESLARNCPSLRLLITSREALSTLTGTLFQIPALPLPPHGQVSMSAAAQSDAVRLFVERAAAVKPSFTLTLQNAPLLVLVCQRLGGIPLAIELAASRLRTLPIDQITARLDNRFRLLMGGNRPALPRQQTLNTVLEWSYDLLSPAERVLFQRLSTFVEGWTVEAAESICTDDQTTNPDMERRSGSERRVATMPWNGIERRSGTDRRITPEIYIPLEETSNLLIHLAEKLLITGNDQAGNQRYGMPATLQQYAREKLLSSGEAERMHSSHLLYYASFAAQSYPELWGADQTLWLNRLETEMDNFRAALEWSEASSNLTEVEAGMQLASALGTFWQRREYWREGGEHLSRLLSRADIPPRTAVRSRVLNQAGILAASQGNLAQAQQFHEEGLSISSELDDKLNLAHSLYGLGSVAFFKQDLTTAQSQLDKSLALFRACDDRVGTLMALHRLGETHFRQNDLAAARLCQDDSLVICIQLGHKHGMAQSLNALGRIMKAQDDHAAAQQFYSKATDINRELSDMPGLAISLMEMGSAAFAHQDYPTARSCLEEALVINRKLGNKRNIALALSRLDETARKQGDYGAARTFYEEALAEFGELNPAGVIAALNDLGCESISKGDAHQAVSLFQEALTLALERGDRNGILLNLLGLARAFAVSGKANHPRQAAHLFGQAETLLETAGQALDVGAQQERDQSLAMLRERLGDSEFESLLAEGKIMPLEQAIAAAQSQW